MTLQLGVDLGGTKIRAVAVDLGKEISLQGDYTLPTPQHQGYEAVLETIVQSVREAASQSGVPLGRIGIGTPGVLDKKTGHLKNSNTQCLNGKQLKLDLEHRLGVTLCIENDANCFALAEHRYGAARDAKLSFGIILGTGVGGGLVTESGVRYGRQGIAGEWGHNLLQPDGVPCYCGRSGCVETVLSGPALERYYRELSGVERKLEEIAKAAETGDVHARATVDHLCRSFGKAVSVLVNILDPDCIVLGGGVSNVPALYTQGIDEVKKFVFCDRVDLSIVANRLGDSAGVFGAAMLVA